MSITERLANLSYPTVAIVVVVLLVLRYLLRKHESPIAKSVGETAESLAVAMALVFFIIRPFIVQAFFIPSESMVPTLFVHDHILVNKFVYRVGEPKRGDVIVFKSPKMASPDEKDFIKRVVGLPGDVVKIKAGYVLVGENSYSHVDLRTQLASMGQGIGPVNVKLMNGRVMVNGRAVSNEEVAAAFGEPNAKVKVFPGTVYINGKPLKESYTAEDPDDPYPGGARDFVDPAWIVVDKKHNQSVKIPKGRLLVMGDNRNQSNDARFWGLLDRRRVLGKAMFIFWPLQRIRWVR
jgi:signal peptidase I